MGYLCGTIAADRVVIIDLKKEEVSANVRWIKCFQFEAR